VTEKKPSHKDKIKKDTHTTNTVQSFLKETGHFFYLTSAANIFQVYCVFQTLAISVTQNVMPQCPTEFLR